MTADVMFSHLPSTGLEEGEVVEKMLFSFPTASGHDEKRGSERALVGGIIRKEGSKDHSL